MKKCASDVMIGDKLIVTGGDGKDWIVERRYNTLSGDKKVRICLEGVTMEGHVRIAILHPGDDVEVRGPRRA